MSYMAGESPQGAEGRRAEADHILKLLHGYELQMLPSEQNLLLNCQDGPVSVKQLYWLRDVKDKYL